MIRPPALRVLSIEDDPDHADLLAAALRDLGGYRIQLTQAVTWHEAELQLHAGGVELLFLDYDLGVTDGLTVLRQMHAQGFDLPVVVLTSHTDAYLAVELTRAGCDHYLIKSDATANRLRRIIDEAIERAARRQSDRQTRRRVDELESYVSQLVESNAALAIDARLDALTGVLNRAAWFASAQQTLAAGEPAVLLMLDVDRFKQFNDTHGHPAGDRCLSRIGRVLQRAARPVDVCGRYGGEEFILLCPDLSAGEGAAFADTLRQRVAEAQDPPVTASLGVAALLPGESLEAGIERADRALYRAKQLGRDRACAWTSADAA